MKNAAIIHQEIKLIQDKYEREGRLMTTPEKTQLQNKILFLRGALKVLETAPNKESIENQIITLKKKRAIVEKNADLYYSETSQTVVQMRQAYLAQHNYSAMSSQLKMLLYVLDDPFFNKDKL